MKMVFSYVTKHETTSVNSVQINLSFLHPISYPFDSEVLIISNSVGRHLLTQAGSTSEQTDFI